MSPCIHSGISKRGLDDKLMQSFSKALPAPTSNPSIAVNSRQDEPLEVRYVFSTGKHMSSLVATQQKTVRYSATRAGEDHHGLPDGAAWNPVCDNNVCRGQYVTDIDVEFSASSANTRPRSDLAISHESRDYTSVAPLGPDVSRVPDSDFNKHTGGATIAILLQKMSDGNDGKPNTDHSKRSAVTRVALASEAEVAGYLDEGYTKVDKNLLEQSDRGALYIMYKRGSGVPLLDVQTSPAPEYERISGTSSKGVTISLYLKYSRDVQIARTLNWTPCTGQDEEVIVCAAVAAWNATAPYSSPQQCMLLDVVPTKPPVFNTLPGFEPDKVLHATMGKLLAIEMSVFRADFPVTSQVVPATPEMVPAIRFSAVNGEPKDAPEVANLLTGRTRTVARIVQPNRKDAGLAAREDAGDSSLRGEFSGFIEWIPSPYQGGWEGHICVEACVSSALCPATPMGSPEECTEQCYKVLTPLFSRS